MKKLELVGIVVAVAAVCFAAVNGGMDAVGTIAFVPVMILAALQRAPYEGAWQFTRGAMLAMACVGACAAVLCFGLLAGLILHATSPTPVFAGYAAAALCGFVMFGGLIEGAEEIMHTGVYRYRSAHAHARS